MNATCLRVAVLVLPFNAADYDDILPLHAGDGAEWALSPGQVTFERIEASPGDLVQGRLERGRGRLTLIDSAGRRERVLVEDGGRREFLYVVGERIPYTLELLAGEAGPFALTVDQIVPVAARVKPG